MKIGKILGLSLLILLLAGVGFIGWKLYPHQNLQTMPDHLVALDTELGQNMLAETSYKSDFTAISQHFQPQATISYCGVASSVTVLGALGTELNQFSFFNDNTDAVRSRIAVTFGGMALPQLAGLLEAHGKSVDVYHAEQSSLESFRRTLQSNLMDTDNFFLVNYQRQVLGQGRVGHISPVAAYHENRDMALIMDTAEHKYPPTWVPVALLFEAMLEHDSSVNKSRGFLEVANGV